MSGRTLGRAARLPGAATPPIRIVHLGLGAFARSHQAWFTSRASDAKGWGIAAYTGRTPHAAHALAAQDGLFTLVERGPRVDRFELVTSVVAARDGADLARFTRDMASPEVAVVTLTVSEAGYRLDATGKPDRTDAALNADIRALTELIASNDRTFAASIADARIVTAPGRLLLGLEARRRGGGHPVAVIPCDNLAGSGATVRAALQGLADGIDVGLAEWMRAAVSFVGTSVDRITPATRDADRGLVARATGWVDAAPVVAEPFADWVLGGAFPSGRPDWVAAGARIVGDVAPFARRKLWLLNGAHTILAAGGRSRGHLTVAEAIDDDELRATVEAFWDDAERALTADTGPTVDLDLPDYRRRLLARFANARIAHSLDQIAADSALKLRQRVVPVARALVERGLRADGAAGAIAEWAGAEGTCPEALNLLVLELDPRLADDRGFIGAVRSHGRPRPAVPAPKTRTTT